jgi:brefeldin A-inhibited guanine nucleotide-exchange protein
MTPKSKAPTQASEMEKKKQEKLKLQQAMELFKKNHKKGMQFCIDEGLVDNDANAIAKFLKNTVGLDKTSIGEYVGEKYCDFTILIFLQS